jgi:hypothetical protein
MPAMLQQNTGVSLDAYPVSRMVNKTDTDRKDLT